MHHRSERLSENRFTGENHFPINCTGENSRATLTVDVVDARGLVDSLSRANEEIGDFIVGRKREVVGDQGDLRGDIGRAR